MSSPAVLWHRAMCGVGAEGVTLLMDAARCGFDFLVAGLLVCPDIDAYLVNKAGQTAYDLAVAHRHSRVMSLFNCHDAQAFPAPTSPCQEFKLVLVGERGCGKSSLVKALQYGCGGGELLRVPAGARLVLGGVSLCART